MPAQTETLDVPKGPADAPHDQRAIHLPTFLNRILPYYRQPAWLEANRWRWFVRNQGVAIICRDTLISNMLNMEWDIVAKDPEETDDKKIKKSIDYYKELFTYFETDFDMYLELMLQDMLDLPFGAAAEVGRFDDDPEMPVVWAEHIDASTLFPTGNHKFPVAQRVQEVPGQQVVFPTHAINRMYMSPRPELRLKGWGMAPPQKVYLAIEMLFRGDHYYWKLLLDTPEAGILDLVDMDKKKAQEWIEGFRDLFQGIDGFKVPVLYGHENPAQWIPLNRPPTDILYDSQYHKYAQIVAAAYGLRLSDIGLEEKQGEKTMAGVIRGERQTKRTGRALVKAKTENHFNWMLPEDLKFIWKDRDSEDVSARGTGMKSMGDGLKVAVDAGFIDQAEGRAELVASGVFETEIDPRDVPEKPEPAMPPGIMPGGGAPNAFGKNVPVAQGGQDANVPKATEMSTVDRDVSEGTGVPPEENPAITDQGTILERMESIITPGLQSIRTRAQDPRLRRLIKAATRDMFEEVTITFKSLTDEQIEDVWLPEMQAATFDEPNEVESSIVRRGIEEAKEALERHLMDDPWWSMLDVLDSEAILRLYIEAYENGMEDAAVSILRALYEEGYQASPFFLPTISFDLVNTNTLGILERSAAQLVTHVDQGTKFFLKRMVVAGVRQGLSSPKIATAIREGDAAERILRREDYLEDVIEIIRKGMVDMTEYRANSIVNTEINRAENAGKLEQFKKSNLKQKAWVHLGKRGTSKAGNEHPCPICTANETLGFVGNEHLYDTVFKTGGSDGEGREPTPPGHPGVCHCTLEFSEQELFERVGAGEYTPWTGK